MLSRGNLQVDQSEARAGPFAHARRLALQNSGFFLPFGKQLWLETTFWEAIAVPWDYFG